MPGKRLRICLIGAGRMGQRWALAMKHHPDVQLTLVADVDVIAGQALARSVGARFTSLAACPWEDPVVDAVFVVVPHRFLFLYAKKALSAGKHVFVEKPGSQTVAEMRVLIALAKRKRRHLMVGFNYRYFSNIARAHALVARGAIGDLLFVRVLHGHPGRPGYDREWRMNKKMAGGGVLMDQGMHVIDLARWFLPSKTIRTASASHHLFWHTDVEEEAFLLLKNEKQQLASIQVGVTQWKPIFTLEVYGTRGYVSVQGLGMKYGGENKLVVGTLNRKTQKVQEREIYCPYEPDDCLNAEVRAFARTARGQSKQGPSGEDALRVLQVIHSVYAKASGPAHL